MHTELHMKNLPQTLWEQNLAEQHYVLAGDTAATSAK